MSSSTEKEEWPFSYVPPAAEQLFKMCWQLETWLRTMVYVELRARQVDWEKPIKEKVSDWPPRSLASDKILHHMKTSHQSEISYLTFGQLWDVISLENNWELFAPYFPPRDNTLIRMSEIKAIRNRIAHFREPHENDEARMNLFIRDVEPGIRRFCTRYTNGITPRHPDQNPISGMLQKFWEHNGYGIELKHPSDWLYAPNPHRMNPLMNARLNILTHKKFEVNSLEGIIYKLSFHAKYDRQFNIESFFGATKHLHENLIHIILSRSSSEMAVTIPAILGTVLCTDLIFNFLSAALNSQQHPVSSIPLNRSKLDWPEYVLWPDHMLSFYFDEMIEPVIGLN